MTKVKRNPVKRILSEVHKDLRSGKVVADGHESFMTEVRHRLKAEGLLEPSDDQDPHSVASFEAGMSSDAWRVVKRNRGPAG